MISLTVVKTSCLPVRIRIDLASCIYIDLLRYKPNGVNIKLESTQGNTQKKPRCKQRGFYYLRLTPNTNSAVLL
jgi:hypothetical protein